MSNSERQKKGGCGKTLAIGCFTVILLLAVGGFFAYRGAMKLANKIAAEYASNAPASLPIEAASQKEVAEISSRVTAFVQAVKAGQTGQELTLTSRDVNVLLQKNSDYPFLTGKIYVTLEGNRILGDASIPLKTLGKDFENRWINGTGTFRVETAAGRLLIFIDSLTVRGKPLPESFMAGLRNKNFAEEAMKKAEFAELFNKLDSITVRDGKLRLVSK